MKKGQWLMNLGGWGVAVILLGGLLGPVSLGLPFDPASTLPKLAPQISAGAILFLIGLHVRKRETSKNVSSQITEHLQNRSLNDPNDIVNPEHPRPVVKQERKALYALGALCCILLVLVVARETGNRKLRAQISTLSDHNADLKSQVSFLSGEINTYNERVGKILKEKEYATNSLQSFKEKNAELTAKIHGMEPALKFYYDYCGILDEDRNYYHRFTVNCPLGRVMNRFYIYNMESMPSRSKPCPYCYSKDADLPVSGVKVKY